MPVRFAASLSEPLFSWSQIVLECFRSPTGASVLSKHIAMLRMQTRPESFISEGRVPRAPDFSLSCIMPRQYIEFTLIRPVFRPFHQSILDRVLPEVEPLLMVTFSAAQLTVKKVSLPNRLFRWTWPAAGCLRTPKTNPLFQRRDRQFHGRAKKVQMIRHDDIASHQPMVGLAPTIEQ
jgi:hypothetical protein